MTAKLVCKMYFACNIFPICCEYTKADFLVWLPNLIYSVFVGRSIVSVLPTSVR